MRDEEIWKTYVVLGEQSQVLGGCIVRSLDLDKDCLPVTELFVIGLKSDCQAFGLGRQLIRRIQKRHARIMTFSDYKSVGFFGKVGFKQLPYKC